MSRKVFTAGEVLAAADVNSFLMDQTVMSFAGTAARGSAIPSPVEGMVTYLEDTDDISVYGGSSYTSALGLVLVSTTTFSATTSVQINNVFTSRYDNYRIVMSNVTTASIAPISYRLSNGGTPVTTSTYGDVRFFAQGASIGGNNLTSQTSTRMSSLGTTGPNSIVMDLFQPALAVSTRSISMGSFSSDNTAYIEIINGFQTGSTAFDGINIIYGSNISGTIRIYGYRNA
jgi:hypothetical protein